MQIRDAGRGLGRTKGWIIVETVLEPPQGFARGRRPIVELEILVGPARAARERVHRDIFERVQHRKGSDDAAEIGARHNGCDHGSAVEERQQRPPAEAGHDCKHGNDEQDVSYSVVHGRALEDEKSKRQHNGGAHGEARRATARPSRHVATVLRARRAAAAMA